MSDPRLDRLRSGKRIAVAIVSAVVGALAGSMAVSHFLPVVESERLTAGALSFPLWWMALVAALLLGGWRAHLGLLIFVLGLTPILVLSGS